MKEFLKKYLKYIKFVIAVTLFFFGSYIQYLPVIFFKIDVNTISNVTKSYLNLFSNSIISLILVLMYLKDIIRNIKDLIKEKLKPLDKAFNCWFVGVMVMIISNLLITYINNGSSSNNEEAIKLILSSSPILSYINIALLGPIIEELVFRESFKQVFKNKWIYLFTSGIIFGALHVIMSPINSIVDYLYLIPYCSMGLAFAYMYYETDNITTSLSMHIFHNTLNVISSLLLGGFMIW